MEKSDTIRPNDKVAVTIWGPNDSRVYQLTDTGYHTLEEVIQSTISKASLEINPEDCVFEVTNESTSVTHLYRLNAHGNLKLIV